jgi:hypothetical protein
MEVLGVQVVGRNEEASGLLEDPEGWFRVKGSILFARVYVETKAGSQADGADNRVVRGPIFMRHDTYSRRVLVDEDMIRALVRARDKELGGVVVGKRDREQPRHDWLPEPGWQRCLEEPVMDQVGWPRL